jgi:predicted choloylglycine hydrolase
LQKVHVYAFGGNHYAIGLQQGTAVHSLIDQGLQLVPTLDTFRLMKPKLIPTRLFLALAKRRASSRLEDDISTYYPEQAQRLRGIAKGANTDISSLLFLQSTELLMGQPTPETYRVPACTCIGFMPDSLTNGATIVAKNFDYLTALEPFNITCQTTPDDRYQTLGCTMPPLPGMLDGMNEHGLTVTYNYAYSTDQPKYFVPLSIALQEMLETCTTTDEAVHYITGAKQGGHAALLMIADAHGTIQTVEITPNHAATRGPVDHVIINTNHYHIAEMQPYEVPHTATWDGKVPEGWRGRRIHESSETRLTRLRALLTMNPQIDEKQIQEILCDHGEDLRPSDTTICRHGSYVSTIRSVIFYPAEKTVNIAYGKPCQNRYEALTFT